MANKRLTAISEVSSLKTAFVLDKINNSPKEVTIQDINTYCKNAGITVEFLCSKLKEGLETNVVRMHNAGAEETDVADKVTRHKYLMTAIELLKLSGKNVVNTATYNTVIYKWEK